MELGLDETVAFVAGSSRGIGRAVAEAFLSEGARVLVTGRDLDSLAAVTGELADEFGEDRVTSHHGDLGQGATAVGAVDHALDRWGRIDSLVLTVGSGAGAAGWQPGEEEWQRLFEMNLWTSVRLAEAALPAMVAAGRGALVFVGSIAGLEEVGAPLPYAAAKAAVSTYAQGLARLLGPAGVRVNCVAPGNVLHPGSPWARKLGEDRDAVEAQIRREVPLERFGSPEEIARLVVFLCSDAASFLSGSVVVADGGQMRGR
jgi:3-oxoacyl-[acyl-carrier protein] reductase